MLFEPLEINKETYDALIKHPYINHKIKGDVTLFDYNKECQYARAWDKYTVNARGLCINRHSYEIVARPFMKFFNYEELADEGIEAPDGKFRALVKEDGSMGTAFFHADTWYVATRGSFDSEQAIWARKFMERHLCTDQMDKTYTYVFEIIYPGNRIVVDYGDMEEMVLLAVINKFTGEEMPYNQMLNEARDLCAEVVEMVEFDSLEDLLEKRKHLTANEEGWVLTYDNGFKMKVKGAAYCELHRLISNISPLHAWREFTYENVIDNDIQIKEEYVVSIPEEFRDTCEPDVIELNRRAQESYNKLLEAYNDVSKMTFLDNKSRYFTIIEKYPKEGDMILALINGNYLKVKERIVKSVKPKNNKMGENV